MKLKPLTTISAELVYQRTDMQDKLVVHVGNPELPLMRERERATQGGA